MQSGEEDRGSEQAPQEEGQGPTIAERAQWLLGETSPPPPWKFPEPQYSHPELTQPLSLFERAYGSIQLWPKRHPAPAPRRAHPSSTHPGPVDPTVLGMNKQVAATRLGISLAAHEANAQQKDFGEWPPQGAR
ncbi:hypothetical protein DUNSADRAFT_18688 [Dunaliella salina]|uniref:Encoded protein n=1 Tax=Dunaliella salina TaxID=3046 RepID=A0ABQ7FZP7_DUNSA|nr:hypothetical protein DUNSADRAFT_18688 [Dunaliella salina]|eukprot:KAF5827817.1 hypothetical protein DUNSADRAFT_18688 [Dunaliella salina]